MEVSGSVMVHHRARFVSLRLPSARQPRLAVWARGVPAGQGESSTKWRFGPRKADILTVNPTTKWYRTESPPYRLQKTGIMPQTSGDFRQIFRSIRRIGNLETAPCGPDPPHWRRSSRNWWRHPGHDLVRHLVLLTCKIAGENRSRPRLIDSSVQEIDAYVIGFFISLFFKKNSLIRIKNPAD